MYIKICKSCLWNHENIDIKEDRQGRKYYDCPLSLERVYTEEVEDDEI